MAKQQQRQGLCELKIGGQNRPLYFGLCTFMDLEDQFGDIGIEEINEKMADLKNGKNYKFLFTLVWSGLYNGALERGQEFSHSIREVGHWLDKLTEEDYVKIFETLSESQFFGKGQEKEEENEQNEAQEGAKKK